MRFFGLGACLDAVLLDQNPWQSFSAAALQLPILTRRRKLDESLHQYPVPRRLGKSLRHYL